MKDYFLLLLCLFLLCLLLPCGPAPAQTPKGWTVEIRQSLPQKMLRGYGSLAARFTQYRDSSGRQASLLVLYAPTPGKAALTLGKYSSDLHELGEVTGDTLAVGGRTVPLSVAPQQGVIAAFRQGATVYVAAAEDRADLPRVLALTPLAAPGGRDFTGSAVPTYLDFFDKYGWGFYYDMFTEPDGQRDTYDHRQDYDFAKKTGVNLHFQAVANGSDTAEGIIGWPKVEAGIEIARQQGVPVYVAPFAKNGPSWLQNLYPDDQGFQMPDFVGRLYSPGYGGTVYGPFMPMWASRDAENTQLDMMAPLVRKYSRYPNVVGFMEPHEEMSHSTPPVMSSYGPVADAAYRDYLRGKYGTPQAVDRRWYAGAGRVHQWADVRVPEVASFLGWEPGAFDLKGVWRIAQDKSLPPADAARWYAADMDDSHWEQMTAPGDDRAILRRADRSPGIFRRTFDLPGGALDHLKSAGGGKVYLYIWDMESDQSSALEAALNGTSVGKFTNPSNGPSWCCFEVSSALKAGGNQLSLHLPWGELSYKIYLSSHAPRSYPALSPGEDAQWVDFRDFTTWTQGDSIRRGMEMIRREDEDKYIRLPSPFEPIDVEKADAEDFGGMFHDTGGMSGGWNDELPAQARSAGLPASAEPSQPPHNLSELKAVIGRWSTEGLNSIDYFGNMGDIQWNPELHTWFEAHQPLVHLFGKYHSARAQVVVLEGKRSQHLTDFPWNKFTSELTWWNRRGPLGIAYALPCPRDMIVESDLVRGNVDKYHVIIDDNTLVMDDALLARIEEWVRAGGIFMTYGHTGQHSPLAADTWAISRLTGYRVVGDNDNSGFRVVPGQTILTNPLLSVPDADGKPHRLAGAGLLLQKAAPECRDLMAWEGDQGIALGVRPLGKGYVIDSGATYDGAVPSLILPDLLRWCGVKLGMPSADGCRVADFGSNSGLSDVHVVWGENVGSQTATTLRVPHAAATTMRDISTGATLAGTKATDGSVAYPGLAIGPGETRAFLSPRHAIASAPLEWLRLQRDWWQGTRKPAPAPPFPSFPNTLDLTMDNVFSPIPADATDLSPWVGAGVDDHAWKRLDFGLWSAAYPDVKRGVFRRKFTIPAGWKAGRSWLWFGAWEGDNLRPPYTGKVFLDGKQIMESRVSNSKMDDDYTNQLAPGPHLLAVSLEGSTTLNGPKANVWVEHLPEPALRQSLAGSWGEGPDGKEITLPGPASLVGARRTFIPLPEGKGKTVMLFEDGENPVTGILFNGHWLSRSYSQTRGTHFRMNLTPYVKWGQENDIELRPTYSAAIEVSTIEVRYYNPGTL